MTIATAVVKNIYLADGVNRDWPFTFPAADLRDVRLLVEDEAGAQTEPVSAVVKREGVVTYPDPDGGLDPVPAGCKIILYRETPPLQAMALTAQSAFDARALEAALDKLTMMAQELQERLTRTVQVGMTDAGEPSVENLIASIRALYSDIKQAAQLAGEEAQKAIAAAVDAYEQAEKLYSHMEYYTAGTAELNYTGDLQTFKLLEAYKCDGATLKVFVNGVLKRRGTEHDYLEVADPALAQKGDDWGDTVTFNTPLSAGDVVCFMWGDTLTMPGGEVAQQAALAAEEAQKQAELAAAAAELAQKRADTFIPKQIGELYFSQSARAEDNLGALPAWTGEWVTKEQWPGLYAWLLRHPELCIVAEDYEAKLKSPRGQAPYYVLDEELGKIRLPVYSRAVQAVHADGKRGEHDDQMQKITGKFATFNRNAVHEEGVFAGTPNGDSQLKNGGSGQGRMISFDSSRVARTGAETWGAHAREYPWIVAATSVDGIIKYNGGFVTVRGYTQAEYDALPAAPQNELSLIEEDIQ